MIKNYHQFVSDINNILSANLFFQCPKSPKQMETNFSKVPNVIYIFPKLDTPKNQRFVQMFIVLLIILRATQPD